MSGCIRACFTDGSCRENGRAAQGLVYDFFDPARDAAPAPEGAFSRWRVSVDYGTVNPLSMGLWGERDGVWYRVEEVYYDSRREGRQKTDAEYADMLERLAAGREIQRVIVDPSAAQLHRDPAAAGLAGKEGQQRCGRRHPGDGGSAEAEADCTV